MFLISRRILRVSVGLFLVFLPSASALGEWQSLERGLHYGEFKLSPSTHGDSTLRVVRADPDRFSLSLKMRSAGDSKKNLSVRRWSKKFDFVAAINAGMYQSDHSKSVGFMVRDDHKNNSRIGKDKTMLGFGDGSSWMILDRSCNDFDKEMSKYTSFVQSIRMLSCEGKNVWSQSEKRWSQVAVATDETQRIYFLHARSPYSTHDFIEHVRKLNLGIKRMMYLEGGPPAQLFVQSGKFETNLIGSYSSVGNENDDNVVSLPIPNVLGLIRKN